LSRLAEKPAAARQIPRALKIKLGKKRTDNFGPRHRFSDTASSGIPWMGAILNGSREKIQGSFGSAIGKTLLDTYNDGFHAGWCTAPVRTGHHVSCRFRGVEKGFLPLEPRRFTACQAKLGGQGRGFEMVILRIVDRNTGTGGVVVHQQRLYAAPPSFLCADRSWQRGFLGGAPSRARGSDYILDAMHAIGSSEKIWG